MRWLIAVVLLVVPATARASLDAAPPPAYTDARAIAAATTLVPPTCAATPAMDTLLGSAGAAAACMPRADAARPTPVQAANTTLAADCTWSVTFSRAFTSSTPVVHANAILASNATQPIPCFVTSRSTTVQSGKCFAGQTTALNLSIITAGLSLTPFISTCPAGAALMVVGREPTQ